MNRLSGPQDTPLVPTQPRSRQQARAERDLALRRVALTRRSVVAGSVVLSAGVTALVASSAPGHTGPKKTIASAQASVPATLAQAPASVHLVRLPPLASPSALGLRPPQAPPRAAAPPQAPAAPQASSAPQPAAPTDPPPAAPAASQQAAPAAPQGGGQAVSGGS